MFINNLGLSRSHPLRKKWRDFDERCLDPATQNACRVLTPLLLLVSIISFTSTMVLGGEYARAHENISLPIIVVTFGSLMASVFTGIFGFWWTSFESAMKNLCAHLEMNTQELHMIVWSELRARVWRHLLGLGGILQEQESKHPGDPYHKDRLEAKSRFEHEYDLFVGLGLIDQVGYDPFFHKKTVSV